jgi:hypothetical protein
MAETAGGGAKPLGSDSAERGRRTEAQKVEAERRECLA